MIPIINLSTLEQAATQRALDHACRNWGAFYLIGHGIPQSMNDELFSQITRFFALQYEQKAAVSRTQANPWGYYDQELTKNKLDVKEVFDLASLDGARAYIPWPEKLPEFELITSCYLHLCQSLALTLLKAILENLGCRNEKLIEPFNRETSSFLRLNYYPATEQCASKVNAQTLSDFGVHEHTDAGALTILAMDKQPGLEIEHAGRWHSVEPLENAVLVNLGDILQVYSNDKYKAALHRVVSSKGQNRYSAPFFMNPNFETDYMPLPSTIDRKNPPQYSTINWGHFRKQRSLGDYADYGKEIQISDFRI